MKKLIVMSGTTKPITAGSTIRSNTTANRITVHDRIPKWIIGLKLAKTRTRKPRINTILVKTIGLPVMFITLAIAVLISLVCFVSDFNLDRK